VAEERREAADTAADSVEDRAAAEYDVAVAQADGQRKIAKEKCETMSGDAQKACKDQADADYESAKAQARRLSTPPSARVRRAAAHQLTERGSSRNRGNTTGDAHLRDLRTSRDARARPVTLTTVTGRGMRTGGRVMNATRTVRHRIV
jgi:hypothetical protein